MDVAFNARFALGRQNRNQSTTLQITKIRRKILNKLETSRLHAEGSTPVTYMQ